VVRFAGDSGDGVQLAGLQFARATQQGGSELVTLPEFPAEIRAPAGTVYGVSAYQVHFGAEEIWTPGDDCDVLVAFNPAAFVTNIGYLTPGGVVIIDEDAFDERAFRKAGIDSDPIDENAYYSVIRVPISKRTLESVAEFELGRKDSLRAKNFWTLGFTLWFCSQSPGATLAWVAQRFAADPEVGGANAAALKAGYAFGETMEVVLPEVEEPIDAASKPGASRLASGTQTMALGIAASGALLERPIFYCSYPITPASALLHELAKLKTGVRTFQAEDEIAAACAAIGASYAGGIGVSASSGPGLSLKTEAIGLAVAAEIPLIVIDVQRAGPSTGMPTKPEQSDLDMAVFGRHGEAPVPVLAPATPADCFNVMIDAARIAAESMTPVIVLSDAFLANAVTEWTPPSMESLEAIATDPHSAGSDVKSDEVFSRDEKTLARPWVVPGTAGLTHRTGGLEKDAATGNISYDPANHQDMVRLRADKIARVTTTTMGPFSLDGPEDGELLVVGWGSTYGPIRRAVSRLNDAGHKVGHLHIPQLWPLPAGIDDILSHYKSVVCAELNSGQLAAMLRSAYLVPVEPITKTTGRPFGVSDLKSRFQAHLGDEAK
jgi:2-oxoglutarate ferredoxin oxidoreductase subunit alpha